MNGVSRPCESRSSRTWLSGNASTRRSGGAVARAGALTTTVALAWRMVPGTRPATVYVPGLSTAELSVGEGQITRTSRATPPEYVAGTNAGRRGRMPAAVSTVMVDTFRSVAANGDSRGMLAVEISGAAPRPLAC